MRNMPHGSKKSLLRKLEKLKKERNILPVLLKAGNPQHSLVGQAAQNCSHLLVTAENNHLDASKTYQQRYTSIVGPLPQLKAAVKHSIVTSVRLHQHDSIFPQIPNKASSNGHTLLQDESSSGINPQQIFQFCSKENQPEASSKVHTKRSDKGITFEGFKLPVTPEEALIRFKSRLTNYEHEEILNNEELWFLGLNAQKIEGCSENQHNSGYDDEYGSYIKVLHDHIAYRYEILEVIGKGSFGQVVKCMDHKANELVAIKMIRNKKRMNLYELIKNNNFQGFTISLICRFAYTLLKSLQMLYREKIIHCDLKPENILLCPKGQGLIKVIDFGSSCFENQKVYTYIQSRFYRSPEVILGHQYGLAIDMWSFGCILAELFTGYPLFPGENEVEQLACIMEVFGIPPAEIIQTSQRKRLFFDSKGFPRNVTNSKGKKRRPNSKKLASILKTNNVLFLDFLNGCLMWNPEQRLTPDEAMEHKWIQESRTQKSHPRMKVMPVTESNGKHVCKRTPVLKTETICHETDDSLKICVKAVEEETTLTERLRPLGASAEEDLTENAKDRSEALAEKELEDKSLKNMQQAVQSESPEEIKCQEHT
ncbi:dual specificity tyrosine-phosphorylation-regulated kinase 4 isoform X2 [Heptranchias perlo]|uniref:dual specificity tyrosine-phosphorylation-regulated kinase 4 isoform X2 n=1 Tax=Heptranchias perlo TaxID=212740 RepID=UPI003559A0BC